MLQALREVANCSESGLYLSLARRIVNAKHHSCVQTLLFYILCYGNKKNSWNSMCANLVLSIRGLCKQNYHFFGIFSSVKHYVGEIPLFHPPSTFWWVMLCKWRLHICFPATQNNHTETISVTTLLDQRLRPIPSQLLHLTPQCPAWSEWQVHRIVLGFSCSLHSFMISLGNLNAVIFISLILLMSCLGNLFILQCNWIFSHTFKLTW